MHKLKQNGITEKLFDIITNFLNFRKQRVILYGQYSSWTSIEAAVPQRSIPGPLLFFIFINNLSDDLTTNVKLFADNNSLFSIVHYMNTSATNLNKDLDKIKNWTMQCKMNFNPDHSTQAQEVIFSRKPQKTNHNQVYFNHNFVKQVPSQKHIGMYFYTKLNFQEHLNNVLSKVNKTIGLLRQLQAFLLRQSLVTVNKAFIRPHLDYGDIFYDQTYNESFHQKMESIQHNATLANDRRCKRYF